MRLSVHIAILMMLTTLLSYGQEQDSVVVLHKDHSRAIKLHFRFNSSLVDKGYMDNAQSLAHLDTLLVWQDRTTVDSITIIAYASPDGYGYANNVMANMRARAVKGYLVWKFPQLNQYSIRAKAAGENWTGLREAVDQDLQTPRRDEILSILDNTKNTDKKKALLKNLDNGVPYQYITNKMLRYLRCAATCIVWYNTSHNPYTPPHSQNTETKEHSDTTSSIQQTDLQQEPPNIAHRDTTQEIQTPPHPAPSPPRLALKTNLLYDVALMPNIEAEIYLGRRWSINAEVQCAWWTFKSQDRFYQLLSGSPELRLWLNGRSQFKGHFLGIYCAAGLYDLKYDKTGYQGDFYVASGISWGYYLPLRQSFGLEFGVGVGYMVTKYEKYELYDSMENHYTYSGKDKTTYIGPTKAKLSLVWRIGSRVDKRGGTR